MPLLETVMQVVVAASATVAAVAAIGIYHRVDQLVGRVEKHDRTLYGEPDVDVWEGLVAKVASHESELQESRDGEEYHE